MRGGADLCRAGGRIETRDVIRVDLLHPSPNVGGQLFGAPLPIPLTIAETSGERFELIRVRFGKSQIARVAANYPERVDQIPQKEVSRAQRLALGLRYETQPAQSVERIERVRDPEFRMILAVQKLQVLRGVLDVDDPAGAVFDVDLTRLDQFARLTAAQMHRILPIPGGAAVGKTVAAFLHAPAQDLVSGHPPQFDQRLSLEWRGLSVLAVVIRQSLEWRGQRSRLAMRPEPEVDVKYAFLAGFDELDHLLRQTLEEQTVVYRLRAARPPRPVVSEQHFEVGGVAHLAPAEFAQAADREPRRRTVSLRRLPMQFDEALVTDSGGLVERDLGEIGQRLREIHQSDLRVEEMLDIDQKDLPILEPVEGFLLLLEGATP